MKILNLFPDWKALTTQCNIYSRTYTTLHYNGEIKFQSLKQIYSYQKKSSLLLKQWVYISKKSKSYKMIVTIITGVTILNIFLTWKRKKKEQPDECSHYHRFWPCLGMVVSTATSVAGPGCVFTLAFLPRFAFLPKKNVNIRLIQ